VFHLFAFAKLYPKLFATSFLDKSCRPVNKSKSATAKDTKYSQKYLECMGFRREVRYTDFGTAVAENISWGVYEDWTGREIFIPENLVIEDSDK